MAGINTGLKGNPDNSVDSSITQAKRHLRRLGTRASKELGQHFLIDSSVLKTIISAAELNRADTVVEIGPGLGILTAALVDSAGKVIAVEVDYKLAADLEKRFASRYQLAVVNRDILDIEPVELFGKKTFPLDPSQRYKVVANLPYYIASAVVRRFLEATPKPVLMVVMVQKEVAESMIAEPGQMSLLSVSVQLYGKPSVAGYVSAQSFYPQPKVDSAIVRIDIYPKPAVAVKDISKFFEVVKAGFSTPRKQLRNSLSIGLQTSTTESTGILQNAGIDPKRRPQTLSLEEWAKLYRFYTKEKR